MYMIIINTSFMHFFMHQNFFLKIIKLLNFKTPCEYFLVWQNLFKISIKLGSILFAQHQGSQLINYFHQSPKMHFKL